ncbi:hypothetical protein B0A48_00353 [Cryoendolithus antarcticus]|uniref:Histone deacetylase n=1 Tax=Cryoendolithus antarcticus TaxID=1507870 RepID=A0A1V8TUL3_9PEZI|nr:hypothetical protein B0A48_00353 [Cryoendolithus antarcticus]
MAPSRADVGNPIVQQWAAGGLLHSGIPSPSRTPDLTDDYINGGEYDDPMSCGGRGAQGSGSYTPPATKEDLRYWRDQDLNEKIMRGVEENGITRPKGHKVTYHYNSTVEDMHFGKTHPMKPWRLTLAKHLILGYGLQHTMDTHEAVAAGKDQVSRFHDPHYVEFLSQVSPTTFDELCRDPRFAKAIPPKHPGDNVDLGPYNLSTSPGADCPVFADMSTYLFLYTGATLAAARQLVSDTSDIAINWSGGLHHAHKAEASGFCYINDIVLAILEMLKRWPRVLYIDIDVHHGDGVEEAFQREPRVMTLSFHRYGTYDESQPGHKFFPGTGDVSDRGLRGTIGEHFALNVPIGAGIDDRQYGGLFEAIVGRAFEAYKPSAIVLQCGADSLGGDRLGQFNLNIKQHGECIAFVKALGVPLLLLGGGGYTARNVARAWCHETALATDNTLPPNIPMDLIPEPRAFQGHGNGNGQLYPAFPPNKHINECKDDQLEMMVKKLDFELRYVARAPWVMMDRLPVRARQEEELERVREERTRGKAERRRLERDPGGRGELR